MYSLLAWKLSIAFTTCMNDIGYGCVWGQSLGMWNAFTEVCIGLLLNVVTLILQFLLSPFTFFVVCMVKCEGIPKFISGSQIPVVLCFGFNSGLLRVIPFHNFASGQ